MDAAEYEDRMHSIAKLVRMAELAIDFYTEEDVDVHDAMRGEHLVELRRTRDRYDRATEEICLTLARLNGSDEAKEQALWGIQSDLSDRMKSNEKKVRRRAADLRNEETKVTVSSNGSEERDAQEHVDKAEAMPETSQVETKDLTFKDGTKRTLEVGKSSSNGAKIPPKDEARSLPMMKEEIFISAVKPKVADRDTPDVVAPEVESEVFHSHFWNPITGNYQAYCQRQLESPIPIRTCQLVKKDRPDQVSTASVEGPAKKEVAELQSLRVQLDVKPLQDLHHGGSKLHKSMTKHPSTETEELVRKLRPETKPGLNDQPGIEPNDRSQVGPRYLKTLTLIRRTQAQIIAESVERLEIDKEASINLDEPSVCQTTPLQEKIIKLKVTDEEEKYRRRSQERPG